MHRYCPQPPGAAGIQEEAWQDMGGLARGLRLSPDTSVRTRAVGTEPAQDKAGTDLVLQGSLETEESCPGHCLPAAERRTAWTPHSHACPYVWVVHVAGPGTCVGSPQPPSAPAAGAEPGLRSQVSPVPALGTTGAADAWSRRVPPGHPTCRLLARFRGQNQE